jgi:hypothetical protein
MIEGFLLTSCISLSMLYHEGNTEEKNNGYVVLNIKKKYPRISWEIGWWWGGATEEGISKN